MNWTGLAAQVWDPSGGDEPQADYPFIQRVVETNAGPVLDVGCGTGRILLRLMQQGYDVDGVDTSADMLHILQEKAAEQGLQPNVYQQAAQDLDLPRTYGVIVIPCGTFCLIADRDEAFRALGKLRDHLAPGGLLVFNLFWPFAQGEPLSARPHGGAGEWGYLWLHHLPDGTQVEQYLRRERIDPVNQLLLAKRMYHRIEDGRVIQEEVYEANERWYFKHEMVLTLEKAGFRDVDVKGDWTDEDFREGHASMVFVARK